MGFELSSPTLHLGKRRDRVSAHSEPNYFMKCRKCEVSNEQCKHHNNLENINITKNEVMSMLSGACGH